MPETMLRQHVQERIFPDRKLRGKHQRLTGLPFRPNAMSYGSLPQGQKGLTLSPWRLGTAGMTLSEQTNNTTLNILHGVRRTMTERCGGLKKGPSDSSKHGAVLLVPDQHLFSVETAALANCACLFNGSD